MATFNGDAYLDEQLESIRAQSLQNWTLLVRDDGSTDKTNQILESFCLKDSRIEKLSDESSARGSALGNFSCLLEAALQLDAEYVFSCDQDDIWDPEKLAKVVAEIEAVESTTQGALLIHHDLAVVGENLEVLNPSFVRMMNLKPGNEVSPQRLISRNEVTGCAMVCNRALLELALPISKDAIMHDWWLALFAGFYGRLHFMPQSLVNYRQHGNNVIGAKSFWHGLNPFTNWLKGWRRGDLEFMDTIRQAEAFKLAIKNKGLDIEASGVLNLYIELPSATRIQRLKNLRTCNLWRSHWFLNVMLVLRMLLLPRKRA